MLMLVAEECLVVDDVLVVMLDVIQSQPAIVHREREAMCLTCVPF